MKNTLTKKEMEQAIDTQLGLFLFSIRSTIVFLEDSAGEDEDPASNEVLEIILDSEKRIEEMVSADGFLDDSTDRDLVFRLYGSLPLQNQKGVLAAMTTFLTVLSESLDGSVGKAHKKQLALYIDVQELVRFLVWFGNNTMAASVYGEALDKGLDYLEKDFGRADWQDDEDSAAYAASCMSLMKDFRAGLGTYDSVDAFDASLYRLCDAMSGEDRELFIFDMLADIEDYFLDEITDLEEEYRGMEMDFSKYDDRMSAIVQTGWKLRQRYKAVFRQQPEEED